MTREELLAAFVRERFPRTSDHHLLAAHQRTGLTRIREMIRRRGGALLADEPGMGKSYIAAALATERVPEGTVPLFIVPASLKLQWLETLRRFDFPSPVIVSHEVLHRGPWVPEHRQLMLIVDEAHRFRNPRTKRYGALCELARGQPVLLVTATPVCNRLTDLLSLFRIFAPDDILHMEGVPSMTRAFESRDAATLQRILEELVVRRTRDAVPAALAFGSVERHLMQYSIRQGDQIAAMLGKLRFPVMARASDRHLLRMLLWRRLESSERALRESLRRQRTFYLRALEAGSAGCHLSRRDFLRIFGDSEAEAPVQELMFRSFWFPKGREGDEDLQAIDHELSVIEELIRMLDPAASEKLHSLVSLCDEIPQERLLIFTAAVATAKEIYAALRERRRAGFVSARQVLAGRQRCPDASCVFRMFARGMLDCVVATDIASEGLNLESASCVIHYDLPWNPVKLEQRNGRAARIGQKQACVRSVYFISSSRAAGRRSLAIVAAKSRMVRSLFGGGAGGRLAPFLRAQLWIESALLEDAVAPAGALPHCGSCGPPLLHIREVTSSATCERLAVVSSQTLSFDWETIERALVPEHDDASGVDLAAAIERHRLTLLNRSHLPALIPRDRLALRRHLESRGLWNARWRDLLSSAYPQGIEREMRSLGESSSADALEGLARVLEKSRRRRASFVRVQLVRKCEPVTAQSGSAAAP